MGTKPKTLKLLRQLASAVVKEPAGNDIAGGRWGTVPATLLPSSVDAPSATGTASVILTQEETKLYQKCLYALVAEPELEHLLGERRVEREIDNQLWELVCDLSLNRQQYKDTRKRNERVRRFVTEVTKPLDDYEALFAIDHLRMETGEFVVGSVTFFHLDIERALDWGVSPNGPVGSVAGKTVAQVRVQAGSVKKAVERAKGKIDTALSILRVTGAPMPLIHDDQLQQRRGQNYAVKNLSRADAPTSGGWERGSEPFGLDLWGHILTHFTEDLVRLQPIVDGANTGDLGDRLLRALEWVSSSMTRERDDDRVVDLCTALETLLTTKSDQRKGEALALRVLLLAMAAEREGLLLHSLEVLQLYELRSIVIHGSARNVCGKRAYQLLRHAVLDVMQDVIVLTTGNPKLTNVSKLIAELQQEARLQDAVTWLTETSVAGTDQLKSVLEYAESCVMHSVAEGTRPKG